jgi:hypothetical protein
MTRFFKPACELVVYLGDEGTTIRDLHMEFNIETFAGDGEKSNPNTAKIVIFNLSQETRNLFSEEHQAIEFYAGHNGDLGLIFVGQTTSVTHTKGKTDWMTEIIAGDGIKDFTTNRVNKTYTTGTPVPVILDDLISAMGLPFVIDPFTAATLAPEVLLQSETYAGLAKDALNNLAKDRGFEWSIQFGTIEVTSPDSPFLADPTAVVLSSDTGMVGSPEIIERTREKKKAGTDEKKIYGVRVKSLLTPEIKVKRLVTIITINTQSLIGQLLDGPAPIDANGVYIADRVTYTGNNFGGEFYTIMEGDKYI